MSMTKKPRQGARSKAAVAPRGRPANSPRQSALRSGALARDIGQLIAEARRQVARTVNAALTMLYWKIGARIRQDVLKERRARYGIEVVAELGRELEAEFGRGFGEKNLRRMVQLAEAFPDEEIVVSLIRQLSWTHFIALIPLKDPIQRDFYAEMCRVERWSVRTLRAKIDSMLYERTALSKKPEKLIRKELDALRANDELSPDLVFQDPYLLDFLGLEDTFSEKDLESALLREIERFLLELGAGFAFVERQKRITLDGDDYHIDLLFFHRRLRRLVVIELKIGEFKAADFGQVELYLRWLDRHERQPGEETPLALILCAGKKKETIELLDLGKSGIHVAEYLVELPPRELLHERFHRALIAARARVEQTAPGDRLVGPEDGEGRDWSRAVPKAKPGRISRA
jgi:predicted nuclease of restriction endonuclease-like (RecB) superfamily